MKKKMNKRVKECLLCLLAVLLLQGTLLAVFIASYNSELALKRILFATILLGLATCLYAVALPIISLIKSKPYKDSDLKAEALNDHIINNSYNNKKDFFKDILDNVNPLFEDTSGKSFTKVELNISDTLPKSQENLTKKKRKVPKKQKPKTKKNYRKRERGRKNA